MAIKFSQFNLRTDHTSGMYLVGYDGNQNIHITVDNLFDDFINGTENTIAMFGTDGTVLADSILSQDAGATILTVAGQLNVDAAATFDTSLTVTGDSTLNGNVTLGNASADLITQTGTLYLNGPVKDTTDTLGAVDQVLLSDASGELTFTDLSDLHVGGAEVVEVPVKNAQGSALVKGDPVYISGSVGASGKLEVQLADASNTLKMPAVGLLKQDLANNAQGFAVVTGKLRNLITDPIDGVNPTENDVVYVKPGGTSGAALTTTKPVYGNFIQNIGKVGRVSTSNDGNLVVSSILRTNDIPNLTPGRLWVGSTGNTIESQTLFVDEANGRLGIGNDNSLLSKLSFSGATTSRIGWDGGSNTRAFIEYSRSGNQTGLSFGTAQNVNSSTERMRIDHLGNVGIGTPTPATKLDVDGDLTSRGDIIIDAAIGDPLLKLKTPDQEYVLGIDRSDNEKFQIRDITNSATRLTLDTSGNIGSGTTTPFANLHIKDEANNPGILVESSQATGANFQNSYINLRAAETSTSTTATAIISMHGVNTLNAAGPKTLQIRNLSSGGADVLITTYDNTNTALNPARFKSSGQVQFEEYGSGTFTGTATKNLAVDSNGNVIETDGGVVDGSGTANYVSKWDDANTLTDSQIFDNGTNVGIGTTSPSEKLDVIGTIRSSANEGKLVLNSTATNGKEYQFISIDSGNLGLFDGTAYRLWVAGSGDIGIGTTSPSNGKLQIDSTGNQISIETGTSGDGRLHIGHFANGTFIGTYGDDGGAADIIRFGTHSGDERMRIDSSGRVGIGKTPSYKLDVSSVSRFTDGFYLDQATAGTNAAIYLKDDQTLELESFGASGEIAFSVGSSISEAMRIDSSGRLGIGTSSPLSILDLGSNSNTSQEISISGGRSTYGYDAAKGDSGAVVIQGSANKEIHFETTADTADMIINSSGNVGIGTSSPSSYLEVETAGSSGSDDIAIFSRSTGEVLKISREASEAVLNASSNLTLSADYDNNTTSTGSNVIFKTDASERMRITSGGSIGVGISSPTSNGGSTAKVLHIHNPNTAEWAVTHYTNGSTGSGGSDGLLVGNIGSDGYLFNYESANLIFGSNGAERMRIDSSGNVGIGTTSPAQKLHVAGNIGIDESIIHNGDTDTKIGFVANDNFAITTAGVERVRVTSGGSVGIATNNPSAKLDVEGNAVIGSTLNTATGQWAVAIGNDNTSSGLDSLATGETTTASGRQSFSGGFNTTASGNASFAVGGGTTASAENAFAACGTTVASGISSAAFGAFSEATATNSFAINGNTTASGESSFALGVTSSARGLGSIASGLTCSTGVGSSGAFAGGTVSNANGQFSIAYGDVANASGRASQALGYIVNATGQYSFAQGFNNTASSTASAVFGQQNTVSGPQSIASGFLNNERNTTSATFGSFNGMTPSATTNSQFMLGRYLNVPRNSVGAPSQGCLVVGEHNAYSNRPNVKFAVGTGVGVGAEADSFTVMKDGNVLMEQIVNKNYSSDSAAASGGVPVGGIYHNSGDLKIRRT